MTAPRGATASVLRVQLLLVLLCAAVGVIAAKFPTDVYPLSSPDPKNWFSNTQGRTTGDTRTPPVLNNTSWDTFVRHIHRGQPLVVRDAARGWPYLGWKCAQFAEAFPQGTMKAEYTDQQDRVSTGDTSWIDSPRNSDAGAGRDLDATGARDDGVPVAKHAPYIWHVKDEEAPELKRHIQSKFRAPYFFRDALNTAYANNSFEFWLSPGKESGAFPHNDGYCESVISTQLHGGKRWRMMLMPEMSSVFDSFDEFDAGIHRSHHKWDPEYDFDNPQGGAIIFPPGYMHETMSHSQCTTATTFQYKFPQPTKYIRAFLPRLLMSQEVGKCSQVWDAYATFQEAGEVTPTLDFEEVKQQVEDIMKLVDGDGDGIITRAESVRYFQSSGSTRWARTVSVPFDLQTDEVWAAADKTDTSMTLAEARAIDAIAYHDEDDDGAASKDEVLRAIWSWNVARRVVIERARLLSRGTNAAELFEFEIRLNRFRDPSQQHGLFDPQTIDLGKVRSEFGRFLQMGKGRAGGKLPRIKSSADCTEYFWSSGGKQESHWGETIDDDGLLPLLRELDGEPGADDPRALAAAAAASANGAVAGQGREGATSEMHDEDDDEGDEDEEQRRGDEDEDDEDHGHDEF